MAHVDGSTRQLIAKRVLQGLKMVDEAMEGLRLAMHQELEELRAAVEREIIPVIKAIRTEVNKTHGNLVHHQLDADYSVQRTDRHVVCSNTIAIAVTLPPAADVTEQVFTVYRADAAVALTAQAGETISGASSQAVALRESLEVISDGVEYHAKWL